MEIKKNITTIFMVPTLKVPKNALKSNGFINAYIKDASREDGYKNSIYLLFKPDDLDKFREFLDGEYERTKAVIEDYDYDDGYVVVVYQLDDKFNNDFELIKQGKYSKTSKEFQKMFPKTVTIVKNNSVRDEISLQYRIFNRAQDLIEFWEDKLGISLKDEYEVWEGWDDLRETLEINKIKNKCVTEKS